MARGGNSRCRPGIVMNNRTGALARRAGIRHTPAVEVVDEPDDSEPGGGVRSLQRRAEFGRGTAAEVVRGTGQEVAALLPSARPMPDRRGEDRVELRAVRRVHTVGAG